ncbi:DNA polymerase III subunit delta [Candidatus Parcubacteria bacterium]|nr:DNA polymerase III subunit delta [Candidatus Parcubacteria bacterium]
MIIFLYGPDTYRSGQKLNEIVESHRKIHKSGLNLKYLDIKEEKYEDFERHLQVNSMFQEKKLIILKNAFSSQYFKEKFSKNIKKIKELKDIILFYEDQQFPKNNSFFNLLKKQARCQEFRQLEGLKLKNWIKKEFDNHRTKIEPKALELLIDYVGDDLWRMSNEINKLVSYKNKEMITFKDVNFLVKPKIETDIFKTIDAIALKNKKLALSLIHKHLEKGDSPLYLFSMISFQFRNLLAVKSSVSEKQSFYPPKIPGIHPYVVRKSFFQAKKFRLDELKKIYQKLFEVDLNIKTGRIEPITALDMLITEI